MFTLQDDPILDEGQFAEMVSFAWESLGAGVISRDATASIAEPLCANISITVGESKTATLSIVAEAALARHFADQLLQLGDDLEVEDIDDAFGELANVVGGNVKGLIDDGSAALSLPAVSRGSVPAADGIVTISCGFRVEGMPMTWQLFEPADALTSANGTPSA